MLQVVSADEAISTSLQTQLPQGDGLPIVVLTVQRYARYQSAYFLKDAQLQAQAEPFAPKATMKSAMENQAPNERALGIAPIPANAPVCENEGQEFEDELPPRDRGRAAWASLIAVSVIAMATWGT